MLCRPALHIDFPVATRDIGLPHQFSSQRLWYECLGWDPCMFNTELTTRVHPYLHRFAFFSSLPFTIHFPVLQHKSWTSVSPPCQALLTILSAPRDNQWGTERERKKLSICCHTLGNHNFSSAFPQRLRCLRFCLTNKITATLLPTDFARGKVFFPLFPSEEIMEKRVGGTTRNFPHTLWLLEVFFLTPQAGRKDFSTASLYPLCTSGFGVDFESSLSNTTGVSSLQFWWCFKC